MNQPVINWKSFLRSIKTQVKHAESLRRNISDPFIGIRSIGPCAFDIDSKTEKGMIALIENDSDKLMKNTYRAVFYDYPSYKRMTNLTVVLPPVTFLACRIVGFQSMDYEGEKIYLLALGLGRTYAPHGDEDGLIWNFVFFYCLFPSKKIVYLGSVDVSASRFVGRDVRFFNADTMSLTWLDIVAPNRTRLDNDVIYMAAFGFSTGRRVGSRLVFQFDLKKNRVIRGSHKLNLAEGPQGYLLTAKKEVNTVSLISSERLGSLMNCMIQPRYPSQLNHLIFTGNLGSTLSIYDWRFGIQVGSIQFDRDMLTWGMGIVWANGQALPLDLDSERLVQSGLRLITLNRYNRLSKVQAWDLSKLLIKKWDPFESINKEQQVVLSTEDERDVTSLYSWWHNGTERLKQLASQLFLDPKNHDILPYVLDTEEDLLREHDLDMVVSAYSVSTTPLLYLLDREGYLNVIDIETGQTALTVIDIDEANDIYLVGDEEMFVSTMENRHYSFISRAKLNTQLRSFR
ncbi:MAG: hypothetical protein EXX96DRAFT_555408 [Benjaminiella poitrasii]|nr:MAG: hypothetical protein EXX96DRAFT_555408 [Benjaminiella poitrasii]